MVSSIYDSIVIITMKKLISLCINYKQYLLTLSSFSALKIVSDNTSRDRDNFLALKRLQKLRAKVSSEPTVCVRGCLVKITKKVRVYCCLYSQMHHYLKILQVLFYFNCCLL
jgi:hypothetical protein